MDIENNSYCLIGYSGHSYVIADSMLNLGYNLIYYCDKLRKLKNPYSLIYLGDEQNAFSRGVFNKTKPILSVGSNELRRKMYIFFEEKKISITNVINKNSNIEVELEDDLGIIAMAGACVNSQSVIGKSVILNTNCVVEHECKIDDFVHIAPGSTLCGNVSVGSGSFIGANSVIKQGIKIGKNVTVGAGSVVLNDVPDGKIIFGNPGKISHG